MLSEHARRYLVAEGGADFIFKTGSHMFEVIEYARPKIENSKVLKELSIVANEYFIVSLHREENVDNNHKLGNAVDALQALSKKFNKKLFFQPPKN